MSINAPDERICAHGVCNCPASEGGDYCSPYCEGAGHTTNNLPDGTQEVVCDCGHPTCVG